MVGRLNDEFERKESVADYLKALPELLAGGTAKNQKNPCQDS
jgi:hypothetical protein